MRYVICYDITNARLRRQIVKVCETYGQRAQYSVFEGNLSAERFQRMMQQLKQELQSPDRDAGDSIRIYPLCAACSPKTVVLGRKTNLLTEQETVVIGRNI